MYEKITTKLRKGYKILKNSSRSLRRYSHSAASTSNGTNHCAAPQSANNDEKCKDKLLADSAKQENGGTSSQCAASSNKSMKSLSEDEKKWQAILNNDMYKNWLRVGLALRGTCDAMAPLVDKVLIEFHEDLKDRYLPHLENNDRHEIIREVLKLNRRPITKGELWKRSNVNKWLVTDDGPWEIAKAFLPKGSWGPGEITTARSFDVTGLLNLMMSFAPFTNYVSDLQQVHRVIQIRNRTMHNSRLEFTQDELEYCICGMQELLNDEVLSSHLAEYQQYNEALNDIEKIKTMHFTLSATIKSSFEVLEDRLASETHSDIPSPSAISSNREILRTLRQVFNSGEISFSVDTGLVEDKLEQLESSLGEQQTLAEEKIGLLYRKAMHLQHQLDHLRHAFSSTEGNFSGYMKSQSESSNKKSKKKRRKRGKMGNKHCAKQYSSFHRQNNTGSAKKARSGNHLNKKNSRKTFNRPTNLSSSIDMRPKLITSSCLSRSSSENSFLIPEKELFQRTMRFMSSSSGSDSKDDPPSSKEVWEENETRKDTSELEKSFEDAGARDPDVPGPSGLQSKVATGGKELRKRRSSTSLILSDAVKKKLMLPLTSLMSKKDKERNPTSVGKQKRADVPGKSGNSSKSVKSGDTGGTSTREGHFQQLLKSVLRQQTNSPQPVFDDKKEGEFYVSTVSFQSKYAIKSIEPQATAASAEAEAATEALRRFGLEVADKKNAKPVLNQFCEAAVGTAPNYFSYVVTPSLHLSVVQLHSLFTTWGSGLRDKTAKDFPLGGISNSGILLQARSIDNNEYTKDEMEDNCAKLALAEANINHSEILNVKRAANELCLRQGGTLPIYESREYFAVNDGPSKRITTMTSLAKDKLMQVDAKTDRVTETESVQSFDWLSDGFESDDIVWASSPQPSYTQDLSEELAAKALLEKLIGQSSLDAYKRPFGRILHENSVHWGYHKPQFHTFEVKPSIVMGQIYFAVVSSKAFHKHREFLSAESDGGMTTLQDARESAARKALLMIGYPHTFYKN